MTETQQKQRFHQIQLSASTATIDEEATEDEIRNAEPFFFKKKHGKRETYQMYRGFLIVRHTVQFTGVPPERRTVVYLFSKNFESGPVTLCMSAGHTLKNVNQAERLIDTIITRGKYEYGMPF